MNKIVRHNYPVDQLPEELQRELPDAREVTLTIEAPGIEPHVEALSFEEIFAARRPPFLSDEDIMAEVREARHGD